ncbi:MAG: phosphate signaling complex PhoU family protein [Acidimicrobiales bacterium]
MTLRENYTAELEQLRLQVEVMAVRVSENLERMQVALEHGPGGVAEEAATVDSEVDGMNVSLTERCYDMIIREAPVASDARLIVSVVRVLNEFERISDHAVKVCQNVPEPALAEVEPTLHDLLSTIADEAIARFHAARRAWGSMDLELAEELATGSSLADALHSRLVRELVQLTGPDAVPLALATASVGRSLERICDHTSVVGARLRYLITGDPAHLAAEVR